MITVFGSINLDLIGSVDRLPAPGETVPGSAFRTAPGGKGANQALAACRAGVPVRMVGAVGEDAFASQSLALLDADGVDLARVRRVDAPTGVALILVDAKGENVIAVIPGANGTVDASAAEATEFAEADVLLLQLEVPVAAMAVAAKRARSAGARVVLNFAPFRADALELLGHVTHLVVNESECAYLCEAMSFAATGVEEQARTLAERTSTTVIVTLGKDGVVAVEGESLLRSSALAVQAIDTVGAGDTFCGYLAAGLGQGQPLRQTLAIAAAAGSLACTKAGAQPSIPRREKVLAALKSAAG